METMVGEAQSKGCEMDLTSRFLEDGFGNGATNDFFSL